MKVVKITWIDSCSSDSSWTMAEDANTGIIQIETYGIVIKETDEFISIAQNYGSDPEQFCNIMTIPKGCIKETITIPNMVVKEKNNSDEDEGIRKELIDLINDLWKEKQGLMTDRKDYERYVDWLEKQGGQKPQGKTALEALKEKEINNANCATLKVKPKFHKGDWIINPETENVLQIKNVLLCGDKGNYEFDNNSMPIESVDKHYKKFKVKYAGSEYNVFEVKDIDGVIFYGIEDEPNHIDYVQAANCERVDGYNIKENGPPFPIKPAKFSKETSAWSEEDKRIIEEIKFAVLQMPSKREEIRLKCLNWLDWLKEKHTCPSDELMEKIENLRHKWSLGDSAEAKYKVEAYDELMEMLKEEKS